MKICVTGHTSGIGKEIYQLLLDRGHDVHGASRTNGFDLENSEVRSNLISQDYDIFINHAYSSHQTTMLLDLVKAWEGTNKLIINIGSKATMLPIIVPGEEEYVSQKKQQEKIIRDRFFNPYPQVVNVIIGLTDSRMGERFVGKKLNPKNLSLLLDFIIMNKDTMLIQEIVVDVPGQNWKEIKYA